MILPRNLLIRIHLFASAPATFLCIALATVAPVDAQRLPDTVRPLHYSLTLAPDLKAATFSGVETIDIALADPTYTVTLNSAEIEFQSVSAIVDGSQLQATVSLDKDKEQTTFTFPEMLSAGKATLAITYSGFLNNDLRGFYLSKTERRNYAVTQFESTDARRAFPSFDEPALKATFDVSLVIDAADTAISNTPIESDTPGPAHRHTLKFFTTPKMSTYLLAFLVGDFQCSSGAQDGVAIRVCSTPDKVSLTPYGVDIAKYVLHYYNDYFGIPYPLKKLDLIALPDFEAGAMENFGAITYRETDLLLDPRTASIDAKRRVAVVIAHEMAHQWFGDLVTMQWWDNIWLNEGFATWMENKATAAMHPEWNMTPGVSFDKEVTLNLDALPTTRAIRARADTPEEIEQMFDGIAYGKASDVLLTVENYLGEETFRKGVHAYLSAHLYANATAEDFWNAQTAASQKPVDKIMASFITQRGEPLLTFGDPADGKVSVTQTRFFLSPGIQPVPAQKWTLPVCLKTARGQDCQLLTPDDSTVTVPAATLFFANARGKGYFRSAYSPHAYAAIIAGIESSLTPAERVTFIGDEWARVQANQATVSDYLHLAAVVKTDSNAVAIKQTEAGISVAYLQIAATPEERAGLSAWIRATFAPEYTKLGKPSETDSPNTRELRAQLFELLGYYGKDPAVIDQARQIADKYFDNPSSVDPTLAHTALFVAARNGDSALFDRLQKAFETSANPDIQITALHLLAQFEDPALVKRSLDYAVSGKVRNQDAAIQIRDAIRDRETPGLAWKYLVANWDKVSGQFATGLGMYVVASTGTFCSAADRDSVEAFFSTHKVPESGIALKHALEKIDSCIEFRKLQEPNLDRWLAAQPRP
jgi:aminopeptidase N/puromycin-sensitive aminopeptidase